MQAPSEFDDNNSNFMANQVRENRQRDSPGRNSLDDLDDDLLGNQHPGPPSQGGPGAEPAEIDIALFNRLLKTGVMKADPSIKTLHDKKMVQLDPRNAENFLNGIAFANYLLVLKHVLLKVNQDFAIDANLMEQIKPSAGAPARLYNWNHLCSELEKIGIIVENDTKSLYVAGDTEEIGKLFKRIERYMTRIADPDILNFDNLRKEDLAISVAGSQKQNSQGRSQPSQKKTVKDGVDIMQMDTSKEPSQTESTLEFILNTLCRALNMKPKQAAALLTNNNQFLIHCCVKGVKSRFEPMINWYQEIYQYSRHLSMMLEIEIDNAIASGEQKLIRASHQNFDKVLQTISCGCYSNNIEVAQLCLKTLSCVSADFSGNVELAQLTMKWFQSKDNGIYTLNYALKKHNELAEDFVTCVGNFTGGGEQMSWAYMNTLQGFYPDTVDYFNCLNTVFPYLSMKYSTEMTQGNLLSLIIEKCVRFSDLDPSNTDSIRNAALSLLTEVWLVYTNFIDHNENFLNSVQHVYKKNVRDKSTGVRIVTIVHLFKLLDKFAFEKNPSAPALFKTIIFSLVESPQEQTAREVLLTNFAYLFENVKSIPIGLLVDPYIKANQIQDNFLFQTFDFDFFTFVSKHPKLSIKNAIQVLDLLARIYLNDVCNASAACVPFIMICSRFIDDTQCQEFILKFMTISLNQYLQHSTQGYSEPVTPEGTSGGSRSKKLLALPGPNGEGRGSPLAAKSKEFRISQNKKSIHKEQILNRIQQQDEDIHVKLKKNLIITILLKIQNLKQDDINHAMKDMVLGAQKQYKEQNRGYLSNGLMAILKYYDEDPDALFNGYMQKIRNDERKKVLRKSTDDDHRMIQASGSAKSLKTLKREPGKATGSQSTALIPFRQNDGNLRAIHELEVLKEKKKKKEEDQKHLAVQSQAQATLNQKRLQEALEKRRVQMGIMSNIKGVKQELKAIVVKDTGKKLIKSPLEGQLHLIDLNEEEERDREMINQFMKKYAKIWKFMFQRYANVAYSIKGKRDFDDLAQKTSQISQAEITKMLKEHNTYPLLISKDEIQALIRLINMQTTSDNSQYVAMLDYQQFLTMIPQLGFVCFSRPPIDKSHLPSVEMMKALLHQWEKATRDRGKSTALFEDPDLSIFADRELINALDVKLQMDPNYPIPEGFRKVTEKTPIYNYSLPACARDLMKESAQLCVELLDDIFEHALGLHFLEPQVSFELQHKVKPAIAKLAPKVEKAEALNYMKKAVRRVEDAGLPVRTPSPLQTMKAAEKRREQMEIKPKINLALKLQVTKHSLNDRHHYQEVAEVLEEMLTAVEQGNDLLLPRGSRVPGQIQNEAKETKAKRERDELELRRQKSAKRKNRDSLVKSKIKNNTIGMPVEAFKRQQKEKEAKEQAEKDKLDRAEFQKKTAESKQKVDEEKQKTIDELKSKKEEENKINDEKKKEADETRKKYIKEHVEKLQEQFQDTYKRRDEVLTKREEMQKLEKDNEKRLKEQMQEMIEQTKEERGVEKQERTEIDVFMKKEDVAKVFETYDRHLRHMYKFYASMDIKKENTFDIEYLHSTLNLREFVRFGYQQKIIPEYISPDDMVHIYKCLLSETQDNDKLNEENEQVENNKKNSGLIDYDGFKKSFVRISIMAQEKLGGVNQDLLQAKLEKDGELREEQEEEKRRNSEKIKRQDEKKQEELLKLKEEFQEQQKTRKESLSRKAKNSEDKDLNSLTLSRQARLKQLELDEQGMNEEDEFFKKWLKQKENLGGRKDSAVMRSTSTSKLGAGKAKRDMTTILLEQLDQQVKLNKQMSNYKVDVNKKVRKPANVNIITAATIESLIQSLNITEEDTAYELDKKLTLTKTQTFGRKSSQAGLTESKASLKTKPIKEEENEDEEEDDLGRGGQAPASAKGSAINEQENTPPIKIQSSKRVKEPEQVAQAAPAQGPPSSTQKSARK